MKNWPEHNLTLINFSFSQPSYPNYPHQKQYYTNNSHFNDNTNIFYYYHQHTHPHQHQHAAQQPPPQTQSTPETNLYFDPLTGQYFYSKSQSQNQQFYYSQPAHHSFQNPTFYAYREQQQQQQGNKKFHESNPNPNSNGVDESSKDPSKQNVIITEVDDDDDDYDENEFKLNSKETKKDYVDAISLNDEDGGDDRK